MLGTAQISPFVATKDSGKTRNYIRKIIKIPESRFMNNRIQKLLTAGASVPVIIAIIAFSSIFSLGQDDRTAIDKSKIPTTAARTSGFVPAGWKMEEQITGDLNGDSKPDYVLK